jgi:hypothetical protein
MATTRKPPLVIPEANRLPDEIPCSSPLVNRRGVTYVLQSACGQAPIRCGNSNVQCKAMLPKCRGCSAANAATTLKQSRTTGYKNNSLPTPDNCPERGPSGSVKDQTPRGIYADDDGYRSKHTSAIQIYGGATRADKAHKVLEYHSQCLMGCSPHLTIRKNQPCKSRNNY